MGKVTPITEQFQHFVKDLKESFWGDLNGKVQAAVKGMLEEDSRRRRDRYLCREAFLRGISTRQVGRVVALVTGEPVSAQTVSTLTKSLDRLVRLTPSRNK